MSPGFRYSPRSSSTISALQNSMRLRRFDRVSICHATRSRFGGEAIAADDCYRVSGPIDLDQRHFLLVEPGQHVKGDAAAAVQHDDPRRQVRVAFEVAVGLLLLRIVGEAVANEQRARVDPQGDAVAGEN